MKVIGAEFILESESKITGYKYERVGMIPLAIDTSMLNYVRLRVQIKSAVGGVSEFFLDLNPLRMM